MTYGFTCDFEIPWNAKQRNFDFIPWAMGSNWMLVAAESHFYRFLGCVYVLEPRGTRGRRPTESQCCQGDHNVVKVMGLKSVIGPLQEVLVFLNAETSPWCQ